MRQRAVIDATNRTADRVSDGSGFEERQKLTYAEDDGDDDGLAYRARVLFLGEGFVGFEDGRVAACRGGR